MVIPAGFEPSITALKGLWPDLLVEGTIKSEDETVVMSPRRPFGIKKFNSPQIKLHTKFITSSMHYSSYATWYLPGWDSDPHLILLGHNFWFSFKAENLYKNRLTCGIVL